MTQQAEAIIPLEKDKLVETAGQLMSEGHRLVQICCTPGEKFELLYSFDKELELKNYRVYVEKEDKRLPSLTGSYLCAFSYENEIKDLFGIDFENLAIDYGGNFYRTKTKNPFVDEKAANGETTEPAKEENNG